MTVALVLAALAGAAGYVLGARRNGLRAAHEDDLLAELYVRVRRWQRNVHPGSTAQALEAVSLLDTHLHRAMPPGRLRAP